MNIKVYVCVCVAGGGGGGVLENTVICKSVRPDMILKHCYAMMADDVI